jgi:hypothetical protein
MMLETAAFAWDIATKRQAEGADDLDVLAMKQIATKEAAQARAIPPRQTSQRRSSHSER